VGAAVRSRLFWLRTHSSTQFVDQPEPLLVTAPHVVPARFIDAP
jgi:hypothetical protein